MDRASPSEGEGCGFDPRRAHHTTRSVGAPVDEYAWGYKKVMRQEEGIDRRKGAREDFEAV